MIRKITRIYVIVMIIMFGTALYAYAQTPTIPSSTPSLQLPEFTQESHSIASMINKIYIYALSIAGVLAIVTIVYGGISYALDPGNAAKQGEAKEIMQSAIWGIVLLAGAYVILKTINPDLVQLKNLPLEKIRLSTLQITNPDTNNRDTGARGGGTANPCTTGNVDTKLIAKLAGDLLALKPDFSKNNCTEESSPQRNLEDVKNGKVPAVCNDLQCKCAPGGTNGNITLCPDLLRGLIGAQTDAKAGTISKFRINSLTGDTHSSANSSHYQGRGADVSIYGDITDWFNALKNFSRYASPSLEYKDANNETKFLVLPESNAGANGATVVNSPNELSVAWCSGCKNRHIHMNFGGAGTPDSSLKDPHGYANRAELAKLATAYLSMKPNLSSDPVSGINAFSSDLSCKKYPRSSALNVIEDTAHGIIPFVCDGSKVDFSSSSPNYDNGGTSYCSCSQGGANGKVLLHRELLSVLSDLEAAKQVKVKKIPNFQVSALTGGIQTTGSGNPSEHYSGTAVDIVPLSDKKSDWETIFNFIKNIPGQQYFASYESYHIIKDGYSHYRLNFVSSQDVSDAFDCHAEKLFGGVIPISKIDFMVNNYELHSSSCFFGRIHIIAHSKS